MIASRDSITAAGQAVGRIAAIRKKSSEQAHHRSPTCKKQVGHLPRETGLDVGDTPRILPPSRERLFIPGVLRRQPPGSRPPRLFG
jgi:hypothetical protein